MHSLVHSRRLKIATLAAIGLLTGGACGGAMLANYTVAGINPFYAARTEPEWSPPKRGAADWLAEQAFKSVEQDRAKADFADPWKPQPAD